MCLEDGSIADAEGEANYLEYKRKSSPSVEVSKVVEDWWANLVSLEVNMEKGMKLEGCGQGVITKRCSNDETHREKRYRMMCKDDLCPLCASRRHMDRVMAAWHRIKGIGGKWWHLTFTVPSEMWWLLKRDDPDMKVLGAAVRLAIEEMFGGRVGGMYVRHRFSSVRPWEELYHIHVLVSSKVITSRGGVTEFTWFDEGEIRELRFLFVKYVLELLGWDMGGCETVDGLPIVHVQYCSKQKVRYHTLRYLLRNPVMFDRFGYDGEDVWYDTGSNELGMVIVSPKVFCGVFRFYFKGVHRAVWFGWLGYNCRKKYAFVGVGQGGGGKHVDYCEECGAVMLVYEVRSDVFSWCVDDT